MSFENERAASPQTPRASGDFTALAAAALEDESDQDNFRRERRSLDMDLDYMRDHMEENGRDSGDFMHPVEPFSEGDRDGPEESGLGSPHARSSLDDHHASEHPGDGETPRHRPVGDIVSQGGKSRANRSKNIKWAMVDGASDARDWVLDKHNLRKMTGVPPRDLRVMDPSLAYPSSIMIRERALVVNLEHVKAIITPDFVLLQQLDNPLVPNFLARLLKRVRRDERDGEPQGSAGPEGTGASGDAVKAVYEEEESRGPQEKRSGPAGAASVKRGARTIINGLAGRQNKGAAQAGGGANAAAAPGADAPGGPSKGGLVPRGRLPPGLPPSKAHHRTKARSLSPTRPPRAPGPLTLEIKATTNFDDSLPFELRALELCLQEVSDRLCNDVDALVRSSTPVFDKLTHGVSKVLLETARRLKTQVARIANKVENVHDELEKLLDSETELMDMCLSRKRIALYDQSSPTASPLGLQPVEVGRRNSVEVMDREAVEDLENMIEAYFEQIDGAAKKLQELRDYISNTEDYVAIELDSHRNQLIQLELLLTIGALCMSIYAVIGAIFGMNIQFAPDAAIGQDGLPGRGYFFAVVFAGLAATLIVFVGIIVYCRWKRLMLV